MSEGQPKSRVIEVVGDATRAYIAFNLGIVAKEGLPVAIAGLAICDFALGMMRHRPESLSSLPDSFKAAVGDVVDRGRSAQVIRKVYGSIGEAALKIVQEKVK